MVSDRHPSCTDYHVAWICAVADLELLPARLMLDEEYPTPPYNTHYDENTYICGSMNGHAIVVATCPQGETGNVNAGRLTASLFKTFPNIRMAVLVGIGGGVPRLDNLEEDPLKDIHLGDVVVGWPGDGKPACVYHDRGRAKGGGQIEIVGTMQNPDWRLINALSILASDHELGLTTFNDQLVRLHRYKRKKFAHPGIEKDQLFKATYTHVGDYRSKCEACDKSEVIQRTQRSEDSRHELIFHQGRIATGNTAIQDGILRDEISLRCDGVLCIEMEAAGVNINRQCLVIRGISDYADSHNNDLWRLHAAGNAAAFTRELLCRVQPSALREMQGTTEDAPWVVPFVRPPSFVGRGDAEEHNSPDLTRPPAKRRKTDLCEGLNSDFPHQQNFTLADRSQIKPPIETLPQLSPQQDACLKSLSFSEQERRYDDIYNAKHTCEWLQEDAKYRAWINHPQGLFWIKGNPGAGKSVLMKYAHKKMRENSTNDLIVSFFFHGQGVDLQKTPLGLFRALLNSLLQYFLEYLAQLTVIFEEREKRYGAYAADRWKWRDNELQEVLFRVLTKGTQQQPVIVYVDALDECGEDSARRLLTYFKDLTEQARCKNGLLKVCLSSRHYPIIGLDTVPAVVVEEHNSGDIRWYTEERLKSIQTELKRGQIEDEILSKARGGFQWVFLVIETIINQNLRGIKAEKLLKVLASCPQPLGELYAAILSDVQEAEQGQMLKIFQWVLFAKRPLSAQELRDALATDKDMNYTSIHEIRAYEGWSDTLASFERYVKHISRGLIHFQTREFWEQYIPGEDADREAQLIHQSVADYLLDWILDSANTYQSQAAAGHFQISRSCLRYLTLREILEESHLPRGILSSRFPLAPYAVQFLFEHIQNVEQEGTIQSDLLTVLRWTPKSEIMRRLAKIWHSLDPGHTRTPLGWPFAEATAMHVLAVFGSRSAVDLFLETSNDEIDGEDSDGNTPLMLAIREKHEDVALRLLDYVPDQHKKANGQIIDECTSTRRSTDRAVNVNAKNKEEDTVLDIALEHKAETVIHRLIEAGADLKYIGREAAFVSYAITSRNLNLLSMAIEKQLNLDGAIFFASIECTSHSDHIIENIISRLLKAGATTTRSFQFQSNSATIDDDDDEDHEDNDALMVASRRGLLALVNLLLLNGSSAKSQNQIGQCPMLVATLNGHFEVVKSLLRNAPSSVEIEDHKGRTAMGVAGPDIMMLLLEGGSFSNGLLGDILVRFARDGVIGIVRVLLQEYNVKPDSIDRNGRTPLLWAAQRGHERIVKLLLSTKQVDADFSDARNRTPLSWAAQMGYERIVKLLLGIDQVNADCADATNRTPLSWAAQMGHETIVKLLLSTKLVDADFADATNRTPLSWAAEMGNFVIVKLLLGTEQVNTGFTDATNRTPLSWAAERGHMTIVKLLLSTKQVDADFADATDWMPLSWAAERGYELVVKQLLSTGKVDLESKTSNGRTPLSLAVVGGHVAVVKLLLGTGKVNVESDGNNGWTPLLLASQKGHEAIMKLLIGTGKVDVDSKTYDGRTPLLLAAGGGHEAAVKLLLSTGKVDVNYKSTNGRTPLSLAVVRGHEAVVELLLGTNEVDVNSKTNDGWNPLLLASGIGNEAIVKLLLGTGKVDVDSKTQDGRTPLLLAAAGGHEAIVKLILSTDKVNVKPKTDNT